MICKEFIKNYFIPIDIEMIERDDLIDREILLILHKNRKWIGKIQSLFKKYDDNEANYYIVELICEKCNSIIKQKISKTYLFQIIRNLEKGKDICNECNIKLTEETKEKGRRIKEINNLYCPYDHVIGPDLDEKKECHDCYHNNYKNFVHCENLNEKLINKLIEYNKLYKNNVKDNRCPNNLRFGEDCDMCFYKYDKCYIREECNKHWRKISYTYNLIFGLHTSETGFAQFEYIKYFLDKNKIWKENIPIWKKEEIINQNNNDWETIAYYIKKLDYYDFLKTPYWKAISIIKFKESNFKCQLCNGNLNLATHHKTYEHHGYEHLYIEDLIVLCKNCHEKFHDIERNEKLNKIRRNE